MNFYHDFLTAFLVILGQIGVKLVATYIDEVLWKPFVIMNGKKYSVEVISRTYEVLDLFMLGILRDYEGGELREKVRGMLERVTGDDWSPEGAQEWLDNFDENKAKERLEQIEKAAQG